MRRAARHFFSRRMDGGSWIGGACAKISAATLPIGAKFALRVFAVVVEIISTTLGSFLAVSCTYQALKRAASPLHAATSQELARVRPPLRTHARTYDPMKRAVRHFFSRRIDGASWSTLPSFGIFAHFAVGRPVCPVAATVKTMSAAFPLIAKAGLGLAPLPTFSSG
jgi:hypothetical protein